MEEEGTSDWLDFPFLFIIVGTVALAGSNVASLVIIDSGKTIVDRAIRIQSFKTPATRIVTAPVLPITKNIEKFKAKAQSAFEKKIQKLNWICETSIPGFSRRYHGTKRNTKLHIMTADSDLNQTNSANAMGLDLSGISTEYLEFTRLSSLGCCNYHVCPAPTSPPIPGRVFRRGWSAFTTMPMFGLKSASYCSHKAATAANCINTHTNHHSIHQLYPTFSSDPLPIVFLC
nr:hypothetical protein Iba_chr12cCG17140 [Ipomoea batatas]